MGRGGKAIMFQWWRRHSADLAVERVKVVRKKKGFKEKKAEERPRVFGYRRTFYRGR